MALTAVAVAEVKHHASIHHGPAKVHHAVHKPHVVHHAPVHRAPYTPPVVYTTPAPYVPPVVYTPAPYHPPTPTYKQPEPVYKPVEPVYKPVEPVYKPVKPVYKPVAPTYKPVVHTPAPYHPPAKPSYHPEPKYEDHPVNYEYAYAVKDDYSGLHFGANEKRDGYGASGQYHVALPDCRIQTVTYTVDGYGGYVADVSYSGEPCEPKYHAPAPTYKPAPS